MTSQSASILPTVLCSVTAHPISQQKLALATSDDYHDLEEFTDDVLDSYAPTELPDQTCKILLSFRQTLSRPGAVALMSDIKTIGRDQSQLKSFSRYLVNTILKPSKSFLIPSLKSPIHTNRFLPLIVKLAGVVRSDAPLAASPSPGSAASIAQLLTSMQQPSDRDQQSTLKSSCLKRDGHRCAFSDVFDIMNAREGLVVPPVGASASFTQLSHVLPLALGTVDNASPAARDALAGVWYALYRYFPELEGKIGPDNLNQYQNLITFETTIHMDYSSHQLAFKPIPGWVGHLSQNTSTTYMFRFFI